MDRTAPIGRLRDALLDAAGARDWDRLGAATRALAPQLAALAGRGPWSAAERGALAQLRSAHDTAATACAAALDALERRLDDMRANKDGWIAYALDNDTEAALNP